MSGAPSRPAGVTATVSGAVVVLNWTASTENFGVAGYAVYRNGALHATVSSTSFTDVNLLAGTYTYEVSAMDLVGQFSSRSAPVSATIAAQP